MNNLQHINEKDYGNVLVTLNPLFPPKEDLAYGQWEYSHPKFTAKVLPIQDILIKSVAAQDRLPLINSDNVSYIGAWTLYGFHEDGFTSGIRAAETLGAKIPFEIIDARLIRGKSKRGMGSRPDTWEKFARMISNWVQWFIITYVNLFAGQKKKVE